MKRLIREPFLHFLLLGAVIFTAYHFLKPIDDGPQNIVITKGEVASIISGFSRTWQRPPTQEELDGLIRDRVREEVYYREALALGLDLDDTVIRRRLQQKLEFVTNDVAVLAEPTETELTDYLKAHPEVFRIDRRFTFRQVYFDPSKRGDHLGQDVLALLTQLRQERSDLDFSSLGDPFLLEPRVESTPVSEIAKQFGETFAAELDGVPVREWFGPIESGFGVHVVFVEERIDGCLPELTEVRDTVRSDWMNARRVQSNEKAFQDLLKRYTVTVEKRDPEEAGKKLAKAQ